mmetsp:Transcript_54337/g.101880  ORF Transcript_54337/g.101880 Transcript_54337/m.101880 type:complete len:226 (+) Transcript_54337:106-783(+)
MGRWLRWLQFQLQWLRRPVRGSRRRLGSKLPPRIVLGAPGAPFIFSPTPSIVIGTASSRASDAAPTSRASGASWAWHVPLRPPAATATLFQCPYATATCLGTASCTTPSTTPTFAAAAAPTTNHAISTATATAAVLATAPAPASAAHAAPAADANSTAIGATGYASAYAAAVAAAVAAAIAAAWRIPAWLCAGLGLRLRQRPQCRHVGVPELIAERNVLLQSHAA